MSKKKYESPEQELVNDEEEEIIPIQKAQDVSGDHVLKTGRKVDDVTAIRIKNLRKRLPLNELSWEHDKETYDLIKNEGGKPYSLINVAALHNTIIVYVPEEDETVKKYSDTNLYMAPDSAREREVDPIGLVVARSPQLKLDGGVDINCGDLIVFHRQFLVKSIMYDRFYLDVIQPHGVLIKVPPSVMNTFKVMDDPLAVFKPEIVDISSIEGKLKAENRSMPTGMVEGGGMEEQRPEGRDLTDEEKERAGRSTGKKKNK